MAQDTISQETQVDDASNVIHQRPRFLFDTHDAGLSQATPYSHETVGHSRAPNGFFF